MKKIISFTAASCTGKTSIVDYLLNFHSVFTILPSYTTRDWREGDIEGEYVYLSKPEFLEMKNNSEFIWDKPVHTDFYATTFKSLNRALFKLPNYSLMSAIPGVMEMLSNYAGDALLPIFIIPPEEAILRQRLKEKRGYSDEILEKRICDCKDWYMESLDSGINYTYITNNTSIEEAAQQVIDKLEYFNPKPYKG